MGIVARQASQNAVSILLGTIAGAVNTIIVLPQAFAEFEEGWGLIKVLTAYAMIFAQFFHGGIPSAIIRFFPRLEGDERKHFLAFAFAFPVIGSILLTAILLLSGPETLQLVNAQNSEMLRAHMPELALLSVALIFFFSLNGFLSVRLKTTFFQFVNETFLKTWYLAIAALYMFDSIDFDTLLLSYLGGYIIATLALLVYSTKIGLRLKPGPFSIPKKEFASYSLYSILDRGAGIVVNNLDIVMVGLLIGLDDVAYYSLAFYIGAVAMIPQKSVTAIANPLTSHAIGRNDNDELLKIYRQSSLLQLFFGGLIFVGVWVSIDEVMSLLPEQFSGGKWVVFWIGLSRLFKMMTGVSGGILVYSEHYRLNFRLNLTLIVLTALTNYFLIHRGYFDLGIDGAAFATALTFFVHNILRVWFVHKHFKMTPFSAAYALIVVLIAVGSTATVFKFMPDSPFITIVIKSGVVCTAFAILAWRLRLLPLELIKGIRR